LDLLRVTGPSGLAGLRSIVMSCLQL